MINSKNYNKKRETIILKNDAKQDKIKTILVGITGGIGTGKTTVSNYIEKKGYYVINADEIAKELIQKDETIKEKIISTFGINSYIDNKYNTQYISNLVFNNIKELEKLNKIVHPLVIKNIIQLIDIAIRNNEKIIFIDIALLFELNLEEGFDYILTITAEKNIRIERIIKRSNLTVDNIEKRINSQISETEIIKNSDFVIENNKSIEELYKSIDCILDIFNTMIN